MRPLLRLLAAALLLTAAAQEAVTEVVATPAPEAMATSAPEAAAAAPAPEVEETDSLNLKALQAAAEQRRIAGMKSSRREKLRDPEIRKGFIGRREPDEDRDVPASAAGSVAAADMNPSCESPAKVAMAAKPDGSKPYLCMCVCIETTAQPK